jgi:adenylate cyclase
LAREQRKLAAILAADVVGYSRLMGRDESGTVARLRQIRQQRLAPILAQRGGRIVKLTGDGAIIEFASAVEAASAAIEFQQAMVQVNAREPPDNALQFRMGVHLGDLIVEDDDLYGDGVNVAARLETEAPAGGIIVSRAVREAVVGRIKATFNDLGRLTLKNIERLIPAFEVKWNGADWSTTLPRVASPSATSSPSPDAALPLPDKPSIAVLPFQNMSGDPEQEYFVDGLVEDITTALSRFKSLFVIARNSSFTYKGKTIDIKSVGRELGVGYVLEGSIRRAASRVRITGQLIDCVTGAHVWADRFDGSLENVFELQDKVTATVVGAIGLQLERAEIERAKKTPTENLHAYDYLLRGLAIINSSRMGGADDVIATAQQARALFLKATELDADYALAYGMAAQTYTIENQVSMRGDRQEFVNDAVRLAQRAAALGGDDAAVLCRAGQAFAYVASEVEVGAALLDRAIFINPNLALAWNMGGWTKIFLGEPDAALERMAQAIRLNPLDPTLFLMQAGMACGFLFGGRYAEAARWAEKALAERPFMPLALRIAAASFALAGRIDEAREAVARSLRVNPGMRLSHVPALFPLRRSSDLATYANGLRLAGLPE